MADFETETKGRLDAIAGRLEQLFDKKDARGDYDWTPEEAEEFKAKEKEASDLRVKRAEYLERKAKEDELKGLKTSLRAVNRPLMGGLDLGHDGADLMSALGLRAGQPSATDAFVKSILENADFKRDFRPNRPFSIKLEDFDLRPVLAEAKTVMTTATGFAPASVRTGPNIAYAVRRPMISDMIPQDNVGAQNGVRYMEETTWTNNAAAVAEGASKPESAFAWTERTVTLEIIATTVPVTEQQLEDVPQIEAVLRNRLGTQIMLKEEDYLLNGTGTSPQIQGFLTKSGTLTQAAGSDPTPDVILKAMTQVMTVGFANPTGVVLNPTNYQNMRLLRTADGIYIFGSPAGPANVTIWGMEPIVTPAMTSGSGLVGDFRDYSHISRRKALTIDIGWVNDDFKKNQKTIRAEERLSLEVYRPTAFCVLSGLA
jgi:HK97 family phage major capsid protein